MNDKKSVLHHPVLVLNKSWIPILIESVKRSLIHIFDDKALFIDPEDYSVYDWEQWIDKYKDEKNEINACSFTVKKPEVIVLKYQNKIPKRNVRLTRKNLLIRDQYRCQYTGQKINLKDATIDHVVPRSRGGVTDWENVVISSKDVNIIKGDKTPEEAGMKLLQKPQRPMYYMFLSNYAENRPQSWEKFLFKNK